MTNDQYRNAGVAFGLVILTGFAAMLIGINAPGLIIGGMLGFAALWAIHQQLRPLAIAFAAISLVLILSNMISLTLLLVQS